MRHRSNELLTASRMGQIAVHLHQEAGEEAGCDPRHLALGLGLRLCPAQVDRAMVRDGWLTYPQQLGQRERAYAIYVALARWLLGSSAPQADVDLMALELALPDVKGRQLEAGSILAACPHFPRELLYLAIGRLGGSGIFTVPS